MPFKPLSCVYGKLIIPQRYVMMVMLHFALLNSYQLRVVINVAITEMVEPKQAVRKHDACPMFKYEKLDIEGGTYHWDNEVEAFVLYAFYIGYIIGHIPGGWLADKLGARHVMGTCMLVSIVSTILLPISVQKGDYIAAVVLRAILGIGQGPVFPTISSFLQSWAPASEMGFIGGVAFCGGNLGAFFGNLFTGTIIKASNSWPMAFYVWGLCASVWYTFYMFMVFSNPSTHPFITEKETEYLKGKLAEKKKFSVPWVKLITSAPVWAIFIGSFGDSYTYFTLITNLPKYMKDVLKLDIQANAAFSALPFLGLWCSTLIFSKASDMLMNKGLCTVLTLRRIYTLIGNIAPSICTLIASYLGCTRPGALTLYIVGTCLKAPIYAGVLINCNDISRHYSGILMSLVNGLASFAGILGPWFVGYLTPNGALEEWQTVFWIMLGICVITSVIFVVFAEAERQEWDFPSEAEIEESNNAR